MSEGARSLRRTRSICLDELRGFAALAVLLGHWIAWSQLPLDTAVTPLVNRLRFFLDYVVVRPFTGGYFNLAVVLFVVLSGFCIHLPLARDPARQDRVGFWKTYVYRRTLRILPLYWVACLLGLAVVSLAGAYAWLNPFVLTFQWWALLAKLACLDSFFPIGEALLGNGPLDTVSAEMWLYAAYPVILFINRHGGWIAVFLLASLLYVATPILTVLGVHPGFASGRVFAFLVYWVIGAFAAELFAKGKAPVRSNRLWWGALTLCLVLLAVNALLNTNGYYANKIWYYLIPLLFALASGLLLLTWMTSEASGTYKPYRVELGLAWLGERSYSLYAVHSPVIALTLVAVQAVGLHGFPAEYLSSLIAVACVTLLMYAYVEKPSHEKAQRLK